MKGKKNKNKIKREVCWETINKWKNERERQWKQGLASGEVLQIRASFPKTWDCCAAVTHWGRLHQNYSSYYFQM